MDTKIVRERKRLSDVKEVLEAPPEGLLLSVGIMHSCLTNCSAERPAESEGTLFYIWLCICIYFSLPSFFHFLSPAQPSSRPCSSFATRRLCTIIWSSLKDFPYLLNCWMGVYPFGEILVFLPPVRWEDWPLSCLHAKYKAEASRWLAQHASSKVVLFLLWHGSPLLFFFTRFCCWIKTWMDGACGVFILCLDR